MKILLLPVISLLIFTSGCANPQAYDAYDEDNACMQLCYKDNPLCQSAHSSYKYTGHPIDLPGSILGQDYLKFAFCLALLDGCRESCGLNDKDDETADLPP